MKKYWILILLLFVVVSCENEIPKEEGNDETEIPNAEASLSLSGTLTNRYWEDFGAFVFKLQLIKGNISITNFDENYTHPNAQVFVTEKNKNIFEFNNLQEGEYTLVLSKKGYETSKKLIEIKKNVPNTVTIEKGRSLGFTGRLQILNEDGNNLSEIEFNRNTISVFFYLFNGKGSNEYYNIDYWHNEGYLGKSFIIDGKVQHLYTNWVKEIKPRNGTLKPNEIQLVEVVIDPVVYLLREYSKCDIRINGELKVELSY